MSLIGVVDCNNFFVSCERLFRPDLAKKPVGVLSSNDGCFVARSQEVKDIGIPMGVPYFKVKDIIKDNKVTLFSSHFALYRDVSRRVFLTLRELINEVEQYSVDEAFFTVPSEDDSFVVAQRVKSTLEKMVGIPVSVGIASSKTKAKYAVEQAKKTTGTCVLTDSEWQRQAADIALSALWGVGRNSYMRYQKAGYSTVKTLQTADLARITTLFGVGGQRLCAEITPNSAAYRVSSKLLDQKSMMSSRSFKNTTTRLAVLEDAVAYHTRHIAADLRKQGLLTSNLRVSIKAGKYSDFFLQGASLEATFEQPVNDTFVLLKEAQKLLKQGFKHGVPYQKVGVSASDLVSNRIRQSTLFAANAGNDNAALLSLIDTVNGKTGREIITIGDRKRGYQWQAKRDMISPAYTTKWTDVAEVKA